MSKPLRVYGFRRLDHPHTFPTWVARTVGGQAVLIELARGSLRIGVGKTLLYAMYNANTNPTLCKWLPCTTGDMLTLTDVAELANLEIVAQ